MKHVENLEEYAEQAERALRDIKGIAMLYRDHPDNLKLWDLQQLVGELHTKTCAMLYESSMISNEEIKEAKEASR
jgi:hypothetical protein